MTDKNLEVKDGGDFAANIFRISIKENK